MSRELPRRLTPPAAPGTLLKRFDAPERVKKIEASDAAYLEKVRGCPCLYCGLDPAHEAAHVRYASAAFGKASGLGKKPEDRWALPLCPEDHRLARHAQHNGSEEAFWIGIGINPLIVATRLYAQREDLIAMRAVAMVAIAERGLAPKPG